MGWLEALVSAGENVVKSTADAITPNNEKSRSDREEHESKGDDRNKK